MSSSPHIPSPLIHLPYDVSHLILKHLVPPGIHIFVHQSKLRVSDCFGADVRELDLIWHYGYSEPRQEGIVNASLREPPKWARRLMSSWGGHWKCEEAMLGEEGRGGGGGCSTVDALMRTCKTL